MINFTYALLCKYLHNKAVAERVNGIIKVESVYRQHRFNSMEHAKNVIGRYIHFYNYRRPHMSIGYKIPAVVHLEQGEQKRMWKSKKYSKEIVHNKEKIVSSLSRTTGLDEGVCQRTWLKVNAPSRSTHFCRTNKPGLCMSSRRKAVYKNSTTF